MKTALLIALAFSTGSAVLAFAQTTKPGQYSKEDVDKAMARLRQREAERAKSRAQPSPSNEHATSGARAHIELRYDQVIEGLAGKFPVQPGQKTDGTPMYQGVAPGVGLLMMFGPQDKLTEACLGILMPPDEMVLKENLATVDIFMRNVLPEWDQATRTAWFQKSSLRVAEDTKVQPAVQVGSKTVWLSGIPTSDGLMVVVGVSPGGRQQQSTARADIDRAIAHRAAVEHRPHKKLGLTYAQVLAGQEKTFDMRAAPSANGLAGYAGSTRNQGLTLRISGDQKDVASIQFTFVLGGEAKDGVANVVAMGLVVANVCPDWTGFLDWINANKQSVLEDGDRVATELVGTRKVELRGLQVPELGGQVLFITIAPH